MPKFSSNIGSVQSSEEQKRFIVDDSTEETKALEDLDPEQLKKFVLEQHLARAKAMSTVDPRRKKSLEILTNIGRSMVDVELAGSTFSIRTLKTNEIKDIIAAAREMKYDIDQGIEMRIQTLARIIYKIDGIDLEEILGSNNMSARVDMSANLDDTVSTRLYKEYTKMLEEHSKVLGALDTDEKVKEVIEDIKK